MRGAGGVPDHPARRTLAAVAGISQSHRGGGLRIPAGSTRTRTRAAHTIPWLARYCRPETRSFICGASAGKLPRVPNWPWAEHSTMRGLFTALPLDTRFRVLADGVEENNGPL